MPQSAEPKKIPLHDLHASLGARMVDFAGWLMPVQYRGILEEHRAVREGVGVFDISHMGEFEVGGPGAAAWLDALLTNRTADLAPGRCHYSFMLDEAGGVIDDLIVNRISPETFLLVVNASKISEDAAWMRSRLPSDDPGIRFDDLSEKFVALAVQGPRSPGLYRQLFGADMPGKNRVSEVGTEFGRALVATTGYTGEAGFEIFLQPGGRDAAAGLLQKIIGLGAEPCGLGARDTLRLEMAYPLNGNDLSRDRTPLEAGMGFFVKLDKPDFVGKNALLAQKSAGLPSRLMALKLEGKAPPPRPHYPVWVEGKKVSETTSGALSPSLGEGIALAYLPAPFPEIGSAAEIETRGRRYPARFVKKPFYQPR